MAALETFCEDLGEEVVPYMAPLMEVIISVITSNAKVEVLEPALSAACSIAGSAGAAFAPYLPELVPVLQSCMAQTAAEHMQIRAHATECLGLLLAVKGGKEAMGAHVPAFMQTALQGFSLNHNEVRVATHTHALAPNSIWSFWLAGAKRHSVLRRQHVAEDLVHVVVVAVHLLNQAPVSVDTLLRSASFCDTHSHLTARGVRFLTMCGAEGQVREYSHGFFANTAMALQADFAVYLPHVVPLALTSLAMDDGPLLDGLVEESDDEDGPGGGGVVAGVRAALGDNDNDNDNDDEEEDEEEQKRKEKVHTAIMDEKMSACHALGSFMQATKGAFAPYIEQVKHRVHPLSQRRLSAHVANKPVSF